MKKRLFFSFPASTLALLASAPIVAQAQSPARSNGLPMPATSQQPNVAAATTDARLQVYDLPLEVVGSVAAQLQLHYGTDKRIRVTTEPGTGRLMVLAPSVIQDGIRSYVDAVRAKTGSLAVDARGQVVPTAVQKTDYTLKNLNAKQLEDSVARLVGKSVSTVEVGKGMVSLQTPSTSGVQELMRIDRVSNTVHVSGTPASVLGWTEVITALDQGSADPKRPTQVVPMGPASPDRIEKAVRLVRHASFSQDPVQDNQDMEQDEQATAIVSQDDPTTGSGLIGEVDISFVNDLGLVVIRGSKKDVERVKEVIEKIKAQSLETKPDIVLRELVHVNSQAIEVIIRDINTNVFAPRQGQVNITALVQPNALLLIGREDAMKSLIELIDKLDAPLEANSQPKVFKLLHTSALDAEELIRNFFSDGATGGGTGQTDRVGLSTRVKVVADYRTNALIVQASPRDMIEVTNLIQDIDVDTAPAESQIRVFPIKNTVASELQPILAAAIGGQSTGGQTGQGGQGGQGNQGAGATTVNSQSRTPGGVITWRRGQDGKELDSGILSGVVITSSPTINALVVRAPSKSMELIASLINELDALPGAEAKIKVFPVINGDATSLALTLQQVFGLPATAGTATTNALALGLQNLAALTSGGEGSIVPLRITTDARTNSIIASGSESDLGVIEAVLYRLDDPGGQQRTNQVVWLRNSSATDVATAINQLLVNQRQTITQLLQQGQQISVFERADREIFLVAEPATNSLIISATPRYLPQIMEIIDRLDRQPPMIAVEILIAEIVLDDNFEFGNEFGIQDSLLFKRGSASRGTLASPAFNIADPPPVGTAGGSLAGQGLTGFGMGRASSSLGYGGLVLAAGNESINMLFRALQDANRLQILSRPNLLTIDNNISVVQVGQTVPRVNGITQTAFGQQSIIEDTNIGLIMQIQPRTNQDGLINMVVAIERSSLDDQDAGITIGVTEDNQPIQSPIINRTLAQTRVTAYDGQTVVLGGLITKVRANTSKRVPWLSSIPIAGALFRFDTESERRTELLVVMTPRVVNANDAGKIDLIKQVESSRMSWCMADILNIHGDVGLSSGNGLWGPAASPVIFPDLQPTVDGQQDFGGEVIITQPEAMNQVVPQEAPVQVDPIQVNPTSLNGNRPSQVESAAPYLGQANNVGQSVQPAGYAPAVRR